MRSPLGYILDLVDELPISDGWNVAIIVIPITVLAFGFGFIVAQLMWHATFGHWYRP